MTLGHEQTYLQVKPPQNLLSDPTMNDTIKQSLHLTARVAAGLPLLAVVLTGCGKSTTGHGSSAENRKDKTPPSIHVDGNRLRNGHSEIVQLHGVSIMGMEYTALGGWSPKDPYPTLVDSTWPALQAWNINVIRIPLNSVSYLGLKCVSTYTGPVFGKPGEIQDSDPSHNYKERLKEVVDRATAEGLYVILDLHETAPDDAKNTVNGISAQCPTDINPLPDADHSIDFWRAVALAYKSYPNVMFELFNDPYIDQWPYFKGDKIAAWKALRDGTEVNMYRPLWPTPEKHLWRSAGMQQLVDTVRSTGATNVILQGGISKSADLELWSTYRANDPIKQTAAAWHAFPPSDAQWGDRCYSHPGPWCDDRAYEYARNILAADYPVVVTEFGDKNAPGTVGAPFAAALLPKLDSLSISYLGWSFTNAAQLDYQLIKDNSGTPSDGYGQYVKAHYNCIARDILSCNNNAQQKTARSDSPLQSTPSRSDTRGRTLFVSPI